MITGIIKVTFLYKLYLVNHEIQLSVAFYQHRIPLQEVIQIVIL